MSQTKAAIYVRVSHQIQQESGISINNQINSCVSWCNARGIGYDIYVDCVSGAKEKRPEFDKLKENINKYSKVVVYKLDRLSRKLSISVNFIEFLDKIGVEFIGVEDNISSSSYQNRFLINMLSVAAQYERETIIQRVKTTKSWLKNNNRLSGSVPFGCDADNNGVLSVNQNEMEIVKKIKNLNRRGYSYSAIAEMLNEEGIKTKKGCRWFPQSVKNIVIRSCETT